MAAGCGLGFALTVKIWAVVPVVVVLAWFLARFGRRAAAWVAGPLVATAVLVCLPFLLAAPSSMVRMVVVDQLSRGRMAATLAERTTGMLGLSSVVGHRPQLSGPVLLLLVAGVALLVLAWVRVPSARVAVVLLLAQGGVVLASPSYFRYYDAYPAPALALCVGAVAAAVHGLLARAGAPVVRRAAAVTMVLGLLVALGTAAGSDTRAVVGRVVPGRGAARGRAPRAVRHRRLGGRAGPARRPGEGPAPRLPGGRSTSAGCPTTGTRPRSSTAGRHRDAPTCAGSGTCAATSSPAAAQVLVRRHYDGFDRATIRGLHRPRLRLDSGAYAVYGR